MDIRIKPFAILLGIGLFLASCNDSQEEVNMDETSPNTANVTISLVDDPAYFDAVLIDVKGLEYKIEIDSSSSEGDDEDSSGESRNDDDEEDENDDADDGVWTSVNIERAVYDILQLNNGASALLAEVEINEGELKEIRLILGENNQVVVDGDSLDLFVPSGASSGLKVKMDEKVEAGEDYELVIDFDAALSIKERGNGRYIMRPVVRVSLEELDADDFGGIIGIISPDSINSTVYAISSNEDSISTQPEEDGSFLIERLLSGSYSIVVVPAESSDFQNKTLEGISVEEELIVDIDTIFLQK